MNTFTPTFFTLSEIGTRVGQRNVVGGRRFCDVKDGEMAVSVKVGLQYFSRQARCSVIGPFALSPKCSLARLPVSHCIVNAKCDVPSFFLIKSQRMRGPCDSPVPASALLFTLLLLGHLSPPLLLFARSFFLFRFFFASRPQSSMTQLVLAQAAFTRRPSPGALK